MDFKTTSINFLSGSIGSGIAYTEVAPAIQNIPQPVDSNSLITALVTIIGGLASTLVTSLFKRLINK